jgi:hypothetical protein
MLEQKSQFKLIYLRIDFRTATTGPNITITYFSPFSTQTFEDLIKAMRFMFLTKYSWKISWYYFVNSRQIEFPRFQTCFASFGFGVFVFLVISRWLVLFVDETGIDFTNQFLPYFTDKTHKRSLINFEYICLWSLVLTNTYKN